MKTICIVLLVIIEFIDASYFSMPSKARKKTLIYGDVEIFKSLNMILNS